MPFPVNQDDRVFPLTARPIRSDGRTGGAGHKLQPGERLSRAPRGSSRSAGPRDRPRFIAVREHWNES
jgi:hypothetical protein